MPTRCCRTTSGPTSATRLPVVEIIVGALLVLGLFTRVTAVLGALLMVVFITGIAQAWARGLTIDCGCFGGGGQVSANKTKYGLEIARDIGLALCGPWLVWRPRSLGKPRPVLVRDSEQEGHQIRMAKEPSEGRRRARAQAKIAGRPAGEARAGPSRSSSAPSSRSSRSSPSSRVVILPRHEQLERLGRRRPARRARMGQGIVANPGVSLAPGPRRSTSTRTSSAPSAATSSAARLDRGVPRRAGQDQARLPRHDASSTATSTTTPRCGRARARSVRPTQGKFLAYHNRSTPTSPPRRAPAGPTPS